jgi:hypothetical protein
MTKKAQTTDVSEIDDTLIAGPEVTPSDHWTRQTALEFAITFHKNNGGMTQPTQVVSTATVFLDFITGDSK